MATALLDDGIGDEDYGIVTCEICGFAIVSGDLHHDEFGYSVICDKCFRELAEDEEHFGYPPADSDI